MSDTFMGISIEGLDKTYGRYQRAAQEPIENLYPYFKDAFAKGVKAVGWRQWTPYFNDGEPCEFSVGDCGVTNDINAARAWLNDEGYTPEDYVEPDQYDDNFDYRESDFYDYTINSQSWIDKYGNSHPDNLGPECSVPVSEERFDDALRSTFGDHVTVVVTPDKVVVFEYDHE
jgi:hypothetical protein